MMIDWEKYSEAYKNANEEIRQIIDGNLIYDYLLNNSPSELKEKKYLVVSYTNLLLKLISKDEAVSKLKSETNLEEGKIFEVFNLLDKNFNQDLIPETKEDLKSTSHIRTMAQDMIVNQSKDEVTYSSTQAAILNESKPKDESADRWGSENK